MRVPPTIKFNQNMVSFNLTQELDVIYNPKEPNAPELTHSVKEVPYQSETSINVFSETIDFSDTKSIRLK